MKFTISTQELAYLLNKVQNVVPAKATMPVLSNFLLEAKDNCVYLTGNDMTVGIRCWTEAKVEKPGVTTLPIRRMAQLMREITAVNVEISTDDNNCTTIVANTSVFKIHGMSPQEFPELPKMEGASSFKIKQNELKEILYRTSFAISKDENRYVLQGVHMQLDEGTVRFETADGKRLARAWVSLGPSEKPRAGSYIIPIKAVDEITKNLREEGDAIVYLLEDKIGVVVETTMAVSKLLIGDYPDVSQFIPKESKTHITLHCEELSTLLRQVALFTGEATPSAKFSFSDGELKISANAKEVGEGHVNMPVNYRGEPLEVAFHPLFFLEIIKRIKGETLTLSLVDGFNPGLVTHADQRIGGEVIPNPMYVMMPMKIVKS
ncbi:MAG: DNA polymerase III subunit beta [Chlamydiia bacterium]|nr:DNA polymerase III subunit beta [Chlamydiia bacterium]